MGVATKDAVNILLVVNDTPSKIEFKDEHIANGGRDHATAVICPRDAKKQWVGIGLYVYDKAEVGAAQKPLGTFGSLFGASFKIVNNGRHFSVGMDCPNTVAGGLNDIGLVPVDGAKAAADAAYDGRNDGEVKTKIDGTAVQLVARRASGWGWTNWGICFVSI